MKIDTKRMCVVYKGERKVILHFILTNYIVSYKLLNSYTFYLDLDTNRVSKYRNSKINYNRAYQKESNKYVLFGTIIK